MSQFKAASVVLKISQLITQIKCLFKLLINLLIREKIVSAFNYYACVYLNRPTYVTQRWFSCCEWFNPSCENVGLCITALVNKHF